jgi:DNA-binding GntR family transcriptional regulator
VPELRREDIVDLFFVRRRLECEAVRLLVARAVRPAPAEQAVRRLEKLRPDSEWSAVVKADLAFHLALIDGVGSARLVRVYALLADEIRLTLAQLRPSYDSPATLAAEHRTLLEAIGARDAERAVDLLEEHLDDALASLTAARSA